MSIGMRSTWYEIARYFRFARTPPSSESSIETDPLSGVSRQQREQIQQFEKFFWQHEHQIIRYLCGMLVDDQTAFDLSQETFLRAWQHFASIRAQATARAWLYRVATNLALNHLHQRSARPQVLLDDTFAAIQDMENHVSEHDLINQVLKRLTPKQRSVLLLHEVHGLSCEEIGPMLGMSPSAIKGALWRARETFRTEYARQEKRP
jgi:RNA polymerase sigma-70 factor, ECF subfamily